LRLSQSRIVISKELETFRRKRNIIYSIVVIPLVASIALPIVIWSVEHRGSGSVPAAELVVLLPAFTFFYIILAGLIPTTIASYSIVGEKVERSLEPLLATPTTDGEILFGKGIAASVLPMVAILAGATIFMTLTDFAAVGTLGYYYFPNWNAAIVLLINAPLATIMSVEWNVFVSSRVSDVRIAQQVGSLVLLPFAGIYVGGELNVVPLGDTTTLLAISGALVVVDILLLFVVRATFSRDEILTKWK